MSMDAYVTDQATGEGWELMLGDSCERLTEIPEASVDLSVYSPPFASLYTYSPSERELGNCQSREEFFEHYDAKLDAPLEHEAAAAFGKALLDQLRGG